MTEKKITGELQIAGADGVKKRSDYQTSSRLVERIVTDKAEPHDVKIARYRDRVMRLLVKSNLPAPLFEKFDCRSADLLDKIPDNSEVAMYSDLIQYLEYCQKIDVPPLPFRDYGVDAYLSHLMAQGRTRSTIDRHIASLVKWSDIMELDDPRKTFKVKARLLEIRKKVSSRTRQAEGLRVAHLERAIAEFNPDVPRDCQDITMLFVGFETLCRQSELVKFDWADFELQEDGSGLLYLNRSKTDQDGEGDYLYLSANTSDLLMGWKSISNPKDKAGPIFRGIYSDGGVGDRLSTRGVQRCIKRIAKRLNLQPSIFSGHSTRVGSAQEMIERNIDAAKVMLSGRWKSMAMLVRYSKKIQAKRSGIADLTTELGWNRNRLGKPLGQSALPTSPPVKLQSSKSETMEFSKMHEQIYSTNCVSLLEIQSAAKRRRKQTGEAIVFALQSECVKHGIQDARILFIPVSKFDIHRILVRNVILTIGSTAGGLYVAGSSIHNRVAASFDADLGNVAFGDVTEIHETEGDGSNEQGHSGWWICKYGPREPRINLTSLSDEQIICVGKELGISVTNRKSQTLSPSLFTKTGGIENAVFFESLKKWAHVHPKLALKGSDTYFPGWGAKALGGNHYTEWLKSVSSPTGRKLIQD